MTIAAASTATPQVIVIGAGFGGMSVALELKACGIDTFTVLERAPEVGGVWQANDYPGAACDVPSVIYQFSSHLKANWSRRFGSQAEIRDYVRQVSIESGVRPHIRFGTEVVSASFGESTNRWTVELADGEQLSADVLVAATGQLSRPRTPQIEGRDTFTGAQFHSAEWDHSVDLRGRRVTVVGGGASTIQVVPAIVDTAAHTTLIQRSPSWVVGKYDWSPGPLERSLSRVPGFLRLYHGAMWQWFEAKYPFVLRRYDAGRTLYEAFWRRRIRAALKDEQKIAACLPDYRIGCARILLSKAWYPTLAREDVSVFRDGVTVMTEDGVLTSDGRHIPTDVVIWCTGFTATEYLAPIRVTGRGGLDLHTVWKDGPEAYLGLAVPGFPNFFMSYGPNTGSLTNTITSMLEYQASYIRQAIEHIGRSRLAYSVRQDVHDSFNAELGRRLPQTVFSTGCPGWYATPSGKITTVWVGSHREYRRRTRFFDPTVYDEAVPAPTWSTPDVSLTQ
ncbi:FAD-dependent pyridine nucleotide-disulphide oxidoreductase [Parafrankia sp. EAN1pec]|uniref:flavin-containing monooxygenase n=1 Tax=Parafrankia sp. (strain EAN1pec) TaxID=298653 RepID=UPI00015D9E34|nr:FAD-dependent pyridine nucleotide-disulphide oxidoreductase [Frankia sp. EAN1pec]